MHIFFIKNTIKSSNLLKFFHRVGCFYVLTVRPLQINMMKTLLNILYNNSITKKQIVFKFKQIYSNFIKFMTNVCVYEATIMFITYFYQCYCKYYVHWRE